MTTPQTHLPKESNYQDGALLRLPALEWNPEAKVCTFTGVDTLYVLLNKWGKKRWLPFKDLTGSCFRKYHRVIAAKVERMYKRIQSLKAERKRNRATEKTDMAFVQAMFEELSPEKQVAFKERFQESKYFQNICTGCNKFLSYSFQKRKCLSHECEGLCVECYWNMKDVCPGCHAKQEEICPVCITMKSASELLQLPECGHCVCWKCNREADACGHSLTKCPTCRVAIR